MYAISYDDFIIEIEYDPYEVANDNKYDNDVRALDKIIDQLELELWQLIAKRDRLTHANYK